MVSREVRKDVKFYGISVRWQQIERKQGVEMNNEEAKKELKSYAMIKQKREQYDERIKQLKEKIKSASGQKLNGMPSGQGKTSDLSEYIVQLETLENRRESANQRLSQIETKISLVEDAVLSEVLRLRYICEKCWSEIANCYGKSESWAKHRNKPAINQYSHVSSDLH